MFVAVAGAGVGEVETGGVGVVVIGVVIPFDAARFLSRAEVSCVVEEILGRLRGRRRLQAE